MKLILENGEFDRIYRFTVNMKSNDANKIFNAIFGKSHHPKIGIKDLGADGLEVTFDKVMADKILDVFVKHGYNIGSLTQSSGLQLLTKAKSIAKNLGPELMSALDIK